MKQTLFEIVDDILNDLDADKVNSIGDTVESEQVAQIVKSCYYEMLSNRNWPHTQKLIQMDSLGDVTKPNYLKVPDNMKEMVFFKYERTDPNGGLPILTEVKYRYPDEFLRLTAPRNNDTTISVTDFSGTTLRIYNNSSPNYWTSFDDVHIVTDSYDAASENSHQKSKTQVLAFMYPTWNMLDEFVPDLPPDAFSALIEEAKSTAFLALKQMPNQKAEQKATRQQRWLSRKAWNLHGGVRYDNYGRKSRK